MSTPYKEAALTVELTALSKHNSKNEASRAGFEPANRPLLTGYSAAKRFSSPSGPTLSLFVTGSAPQSLA